MSRALIRQEVLRALEPEERHHEFVEYYFSEANIAYAMAILNLVNNNYIASPPNETESKPKDSTIGNFSWLSMVVNNNSTDETIEYIDYGGTAKTPAEDSGFSEFANKLLFMMGFFAVPLSSVENHIVERNRRLIQLLDTLRAVGNIPYNYSENVHDSDSQNTYLFALFLVSTQFLSAIYPS